MVGGLDTAGQCGAVKDACGGIQCGGCPAGLECRSNVCKQASSAAPLQQSTLVVALSFIGSMIVIVSLF
jgi:hypothetical protein